MAPLGVAVDAAFADRETAPAAATASQNCRQADEHVDRFRPSAESMYKVRPDESTSTLPNDVLATCNPEAPPAALGCAAGSDAVLLLPPQALRVRRAVAATAV